MKKIFLSVPVIIVYAALYVLGHMLKDNLIGWISVFILFLFLPLILNVLLFDKKKLPMSFLISGLFVFALMFIIGMDDFYTVFGVEINLNGYMGLLYGVMAIILMAIGGISKLTTLKSKTISDI